jgi:hypothetical protein
MMAATTISEAWFRNFRLLAALNGRYHGDVLRYCTKSENQPLRLDKGMANIRTG